jgi:hypothetical protein
MKQNKTTEQYEFEKHANELTFTPQINRNKVNPERKRIDQRVNEITIQKQMKLQDLAVERKSQFSTSYQIADGVNYKLPVGGREGSSLSPTGKQRTSQV